MNFHSDTVISKRGFFGEGTLKGEEIMIWGNKMLTILEC